MRDFNTTRQIYLREFLIEFNKLKFEEYDYNEKIFDAYLKIINLLKRVDLRKKDFFEIYDKNENLQFIGKKIIEEEKISRIFSEFDEDDKKNIIKNTFEKLENDLNEFCYKDFQKYQILKEDLKKIFKLREITDYYERVIGERDDGSTPNDSYPNGLFNKSVNSILDNDYVVKNGFLKNLYNAFFNGLKLIMFSKFFMSKTKKIDKFVYSLKDSYLIDEKIDYYSFEQIINLRLNGKKKNIFLFCNVAHYLNLEFNEILIVRDVLNKMKRETLKTDFEKIYNILFPNSLFFNKKFLNEDNLKKNLNKKEKREI